MSWSNKVIFKFIELYRKEPAIWNPRNQFYKDKAKINEAWNRISEEMGVSVEVLKKKKETLMTAFRLNHKKKLTSGEEGVQPIWIFYKALAAFLADVYDSRTGISSADDGATSSSTKTFQEKLDSIELNVEELSNGENSLDSMRYPAKKRHRSETVPFPQSDETSPHACDAILTHAMSTAAAVISKLNRNTEDNEDESDIFGKLIAKKLRKLSYLERLELMYEIDSLFIHKLIKQQRLSVNSDDNTLT